MPLSQRPQRRQIQDFSGQPRTLLSGTEAYIKLWPEQEPPETGMQTGTLLLLGLGPEPAEVAEFFCAWKRVFVVECPEFVQAMGWEKLPLPQGWQELKPEEALGMAHTGFGAGLPVTVVTYAMGARLFPAFWGPVLGGMQALLPVADAHEVRPDVPFSVTPAPQGGIWLPGQGLLAEEMRHAILEGGREYLNPPLENFGEFRAFVRRQKLGACISINTRGLDAARFYLLQALGVPVALWLVDNPWLILSAQKAPWWKEAVIFVTDPSYIKSLSEHGAKNVHFLPLAASPLFRPLGNLPRAPKGVLYAGSSAFAQHSAYFAAATLPETTEKAALALERQGVFPDFAMWAQALGVENFWPGHQARAVGLGAQKTGLRRKAAWLRAAGPLTLIGDEGWLEALPECQNSQSHICLLPPVPYHDLATWYASASITLSLGDTLLPDALNQRHFDVWQAGGFLLSAPGTGLDYFPVELVEPITVSCPQALEEAAAAWGRASPARLLLQDSWRKFLSHGHTYADRLRLLLQRLR